MTAVTNIWHQLVQRRLWPVAILLIAGLVAVPVLLAKDPEVPQAPPAVAEPAGADELAVTPIVAPAAPEDRAERRKVVGSKKNPFAVAAKADSGVTTSNTETATNATTTGEGSSSTSESTGGSQSGGGSGSTGSDADPAPADDPEPKPAAKKRSPQELTVRFGADDSLERRSVKVDQPLPSVEAPLLIYMGLERDGKTAVFLVDHGVKAVGDGECEPTPETCETVKLRAGDTEFFDVVDASGKVVAQYQLDLIKIHNPGNAVSRSARVKARSAVVKAAGTLGAEPELSGAVAGTTVGLP